MDIVYLFGFSEMMERQLERLLPILKGQLKKNHQIGFVLMHDGVIGFSEKGKTPESIKDLLGLDIALYALKPDIKARGIPFNQLHERVNPIEYDDLVDILESARKVISWL